MKDYQKATANGESFTVQGNDGVGTLVETLTVATTLTGQDNGKTFILRGATEGALITLGAVGTLANFKCKFIVGAAFATTAWTVKATTNVLFGGAIVNSTFVGCSAQNLITFAHGAETPGDWLELVSDGVGIFVTGVAAAAGGITFTAP